MRLIRISKFLLPLLLLVLSPTLFKVTTAQEETAKDADAAANAAAFAALPFADYGIDDETSESTNADTSAEDADAAANAAAFAALPFADYSPNDEAGVHSNNGHSNEDADAAANAAAFAALPFADYSPDDETADHSTSAEDADAAANAAAFAALPFADYSPDDEAGVHSNNGDSNEDADAAANAAAFAALPFADYSPDDETDDDSTSAEDADAAANAAAFAALPFADYSPDDESDIHGNNGDSDEDADAAANAAAFAALPFADYSQDDVEDNKPVATQSVANRKAKQSPDDDSTSAEDNDAAANAAAFAALPFADYGFDDETDAGSNNGDSNEDADAAANAAAFAALPFADYSPDDETDDDSTSPDTSAEDADAAANAAAFAALPFADYGFDDETDDDSTSPDTSAEDADAAANAAAFAALPFADYGPDDETDANSNNGDSNEDVDAAANAADFAALPFADYSPDDEADEGTNNDPTEEDADAAANAAAFAALPFADYNPDDDTDVESNNGDSNEDDDAAANAAAFAALPFADVGPDDAEDDKPVAVVDEISQHVANRRAKQRKAARNIKSARRIKRQNKTAANDEEECEEAWDYMEFLKNKVKDQIEIIMQETMFQPQALLEATVADTMSQVLVIRDAILERTKAIRTEDGSVVVCPEQGIRQEEFLINLRMDIMTVLLRLIEPDAATPEALQDIGRQLLAIRTMVNGKITQIIALRESSISISNDITEECDCGILSQVLVGLDRVIDSANNKEANKGAEPEGPIPQLTMVLMAVDGQIGSLYNEILGQLDVAKRSEASEELISLKEVSRSVNEILSKLVDLQDKPTASAETKTKRLINREVLRVRNDVDRQLQQCRKTCITECEACGALKIDEVLDKMADYNVSLVTLDEADAKESIRADLISYLTQLNGEMTQLLTAKIESETGNLDTCDKETLEVINSVKGPMWMLVNNTIFGNGAGINEMVTALNIALFEMRTKYCDATSAPKQIASVDEEDNCDAEEIETAGEWIVEIDKIIAENLFKTNDDDQGQARTDAMLGFLELRSSMEERIRQLFQENLVCTEEVDQIKQFYSEQISKCLAEMMNPRYRFENKSRAQRVQCVKQLRVNMERRRGDLLLREIERKLQERSNVLFFPDSL